MRRQRPSAALPRWRCSPRIAVVVRRRPRAAAAEPPRSARPDRPRPEGPEDPNLKPPEKARTARGHAGGRQDVYDFTETSKRALGGTGTHAHPRSASIRAALRRCPRARPSEGRLYGGETIEYAGDAVDGDQAAVNPDRDPQGLRVPIQYRMQRKASAARYDVVTRA